MAQLRQSIPGMLQRWPGLLLNQRLAGALLTIGQHVLFSEVALKLGDAAQLGTEFCQLINSLGSGALLGFRLEWA